MIQWLLLWLVSFIPLLAAIDHDWDKYKQKVMIEQKHIPGWCVFEKADKQMNLIYETHPKTVVEIGVFGGSSVFPMAQALRFLGSGVIHAIDPWAAQDCQVGYDPNDPNYQWWTDVNLEKIYKNFCKLIKKHRLAKFCHIMRTTSREAVDQFLDESIDIIHIDGNHTEDQAFADVQMFLPKVKRNGYIWFDDANWSSTTKAVQYLLERCMLDQARSVGNECLLFQKL